MRGGQRGARQGSGLVTAGLDVLVVVLDGGGTVAGVRSRSHCEAWRRWLTPSVAREADAGATADTGTVLTRGTFYSEGARHLALATEAALRQGQKRILVTGLVPGAKVALNGQVGVVLLARGSLGLGLGRDCDCGYGRRERWWRRGVLYLEGTRRRVHGVPEARGGLARRALVQRTQIETEDAVRQ